MAARKRIGTLFVEKGLLNESDTDRIAEYAERSGRRFGDAAQELGLVKREDLVALFGKSDADFFYLDSRYFPETTKNLLSPDEILRFGALPLGSKKSTKLFRSGTIVNVGMLDPSDTSAIKAMEAIFRSRGNALGIKVFLILADQFLDALDRVYGQKEEDFQGKPLQETLALYLDL
jgi:hypothetical protein